MTRFARYAALVLPLLAGGVAHAETTKPVPPVVAADLAVSAYVTKISEGILTPEQTSKLKSIAHQKATALDCEAFDIDNDKYIALFTSVYPPQAEFDAKPEEEQLKIHSIVMVTLGTYMGAQLALASSDVPGFCANGETERADPAALGLIWAAKS